MFQANRADIVTLDAGEIYSAVKQFDLVAIAKEIYSDGRFKLTFLRCIFSTDLKSGLLKNTFLELNPIQNELGA